MILFLFVAFNITLERRQLKTLIVSTNIDWKILFLEIFDPRSSIVKSVLDCRLSGVNMSVLILRLNDFC